MTVLRENFSKGTRDLRLNFHFLKTWPTLVIISFLTLDLIWKNFKGMWVFLQIQKGCELLLQDCKQKKISMLICQKILFLTNLILRNGTSYANDSKEISSKQNSINSKVNLEEPIASSKYRTLGTIQIIRDTFMTAFHVTFYHKITVLTTYWLWFIKV